MTAVSALRTVAALAGLLVTAPIDLALVGVALIRRPSEPQTDETLSRKTVLISGGKMTKALHLARAFHRAGHRVILVESAKYRYTGHRFSRAVDRFYLVPEPGDSKYAEALLDVVERENVDVFVPVASPAASIHDADARKLLDGYCEVIHGDSYNVRMVDDKDQFSELARSFGLRVPDSRRITDPAQVLGFDFPPGREYILKRIAYNPVGRMDLTRLRCDTPESNAQFVSTLHMSENDPWILQQFVSGQEYCTHGTVRDGKLQVYGCCESSAFQVYYAMADQPEIRSWVETFVESSGTTGQLSFDFIVADDGHPYAIECNPRTHSAITMFYDHRQLAAAYLEDHHDLIVPTSTSRPTYWIYHELWSLLTEGDRVARIRRIRTGRDALYESWDPWPYFMVHHVQIPFLLISNMRRGKSWTRIDFNIGKLVESGGD